MKAPIRITVTGAAGQIGYATLFRIASGDMLGREQPIILQLLDLPQAQTMLRGVMMELEDCAFPLLQQIIITDDPRVAFRDTEIALLIGARPRSKGMERRDLLEANGAIFSAQGKLLNELASRHVKVLVVGNPANTNALLAMKNAPDLDPHNFSAMMRLDHNRAIAQVAQKLFQPIRDIQKMIIWGNHSGTQYPDLDHAQIRGMQPAEAIRLMGKRLLTTHLQDNFGKNDDHLPPGCGTIDWPATIGALREVNYQGTLMVEISDCPGGREPDAVADTRKAFENLSRFTGRRQ